MIPEPTPTAPLVLRAMHCHADADERVANVVNAASIAIEASLISLLLNLGGLWSNWRID
jgi:hypothetical protein